MPAKKLSIEDAVEKIEQLNFELKSIEHGKQEIVKIIENIAAISEERRIRLYRGSIPYGGYLLKANEARIVSVSMRCDGLPLILEIIDAEKLGIMDSRKLGVLLESVVLKKADGTELKLQHLGS